MSFKPAILKFSEASHEGLFKCFSAGYAPIINNPYRDYKKAAIWAGGVVFDVISKSPDDKELWQFICEQRKTRNEQVFILDNCPIDKDLLPVNYRSKTKDYPDNPHDRGKNGFVCEYTLLGMSWLFKNLPMKHPYEHDGHVIHHLYPREQTLATASSLGGAKFSHHVENPYEVGELSIQWFSILALRNNKTPTSFATSEQITQRLEEAFSLEELAIMKSTEGGGRFRFVSSISQSRASELVAPLVELDNEGNFKSFRIQTEEKRLVVAYPDAPDSALVGDIIERLKAAFTDIGSKLVLKPGQMLVIDNRRCTHGREELHPLDRDPENLMSMRQLTRLWNREMVDGWDFDKLSNWLSR